MMGFLSALGYFSGIYFIQPNIDPAILIRTASVIHVLDAVLCYIIATQSGRNRTLWTLAGLVLGILAMGPLFIVAERGSGSQENSESLDRES